jgi:hypothetical protein
MRLILYLLLAKAVLWVVASFWPGDEGEPAFIGAVAPPTKLEVAGGDRAAPTRYASRHRSA